MANYVVTRMLYIIDFNILVALTKNPSTMSDYYPFPPEALEAHRKATIFNSKLKEYLWHKSRYDRGEYGSAVTKNDLAGIRITCRLLYADLRELDPHRTLLEVPKLKIHW